MSNGIKRIGKGLFAIFMIKLTLVVGVLAFQACQTESNFDSNAHEEAKTNFLAALQESNNRLNEIVIRPSNTKGSDKNDSFMKNYEDQMATFKMCLVLNHDDSTGATAPSNTGVIDPTDINTIGEVIDLGNDTGTRPTVIDDNIADDIANDPVAFGFSMCFDIPQQPTVAALDPAIIEAKNYLYQFGLTEQEIQEMISIEGGNEIDLIPLVMTMTNVEQNNPVAMNYLSLFAPTVNAQSLEDVGRCAAYAIGADVLYALGSGDASKWTKKSIKKAFGAVAKRFLGPIGVAIAVVSFGLCLFGAA